MIKSEYEKQMNAVMRFIDAETEEARQQARQELRAMMAGKTILAESSQNIERTVERVIMDLGIPCHIKGYNYLKSAIGMVVRKHDMVCAITTELYPAVAKEYNTTPSRVERAIRHAIECGWDRVDLDIMAEYFGNTIRADKGKPTNGEFIARVANVVRSHLNEAA